MSENIEEPDYEAQAVAALTAAARRTYTTPTGEQQRRDFGEIVCHVVTTVAANLGSIEGLLAGRPGSWEADFVRQIVGATTTEDQLLAWRSEPVRLLLDPEGEFIDFGLSALLDEDRDATLNRGYANGSEAEQDEADRVVEAMEEIYEEDLSAYVTAWTETVRQILTDRSVTVPVEVERTALTAPAPGWDPFTDGIYEAARQRTPLPVTGTPPDWTSGSPADAFRAAGQTYLARAAERQGRAGS